MSIHETEYEMAIKTLQLSNHQYTIFVDIDAQRNVIDTIPFAKRFVGRRFEEVCQWMERIGKTKVTSITFPANNIILIRCIGPDKLLSKPSIPVGFLAPYNNRYRIIWSEKDQEYVGLCAEFPSLSWLAPNPVAALRGIVELAIRLKEKRL